jgi:hypothetical protein
VGLKVAILGLAQSSRHLAPWNDAKWELWGLAWDSERYKFHLAIEPHDLADLTRPGRPPVKPYFEKIQHCSRLLMDDACAQVPGAERFPFEEVAADVGDYWCSSIAYLLSLAIHRKAEEIALYGVDMRAEDEYFIQRPNLEYLIGFARGRGIKVHIPDTSPLCKFVSDPGADYVERYGKTRN